MMQSENRGSAGTFEDAEIMLIPKTAAGRPWDRGTHPQGAQEAVPWESLTVNFR